MNRVPAGARLTGLFGAVALIAAACGAGGAPASVPPASVPPAGIPNPWAPSGGVIDCGLAVEADDREGAFLAGGVPRPTSGVTVEALVAIGEGGPALTGRRLLFAGRLAGEPADVVLGPSHVFVRAAAASDGACGGDLVIVLPGDAGAGLFKGEALARGTLAGIAVGGGEVTGCTAVVGHDESIGVECSMTGIKAAEQSGVGSLWVRLRWAGEPVRAAAAPGWAQPLLAGLNPGEDGEVPGPGGAASLALAVDAPALGLSFSATGDEGAQIRLEPADGGITWSANLPFAIEGGGETGSVPPGGEAVSPAPGLPARGLLVVTVPDYRVPGAQGQALVYLGLGDVRESLQGADCRVVIDADETGGTLTCALREPYDEGAVPTGQLQATWASDALERNVGEAVLVTWRLGGSYLSEGQATVYQPITSPLAPGMFAVPDVRTGGSPSEAELLRIRIFAFTGDGVYRGEAVDVSLQGVPRTSPRLIGAGRLPMPATPDEAVRARELWTPVFGECRATITDDGRSGDVVCAPDPQGRDLPYGGSTTLTASWRPAP
jgi:hypothetical protein